MTSRALLFMTAVATASMLVGCKEANLAIDFALGTRSPSFLASHQLSSFSGSWLRKRTAEGRVLVSEDGVSTNTMQPRTPEDAASNMTAEQDTKTSPGGDQQDKGQAQKQPSESKLVIKSDVVPDRTNPPYGRDPFQPPMGEVGPKECPPSMPLCRFDPSQLKLRGLIQVGNGQFKGMVEDPDGRGYFITPGMQISGATVTQVSKDRVTLFVHKSKRIDWMVLEGRETQN